MAPRCSFCSKSQNEVTVLVAGPSVYICSECIAVCIGILEERKASEAAVTPEPSVLERLDRLEARVAKLEG